MPQLPVKRDLEERLLLALVRDILIEKCYTFTRNLFLVIFKVTLK